VNWAQQAGTAAALHQVAADFKRVGGNGTVEWKPTGMQPIRTSLPWDEHAIVFERAMGAPQINPAVAMDAAAFDDTAPQQGGPGTPAHGVVQDLELW